MAEYIEYTKEWLLDAIRNSNSLREIIRKAGRDSFGYKSYNEIYKKLDEYSIDFKETIKNNRIRNNKPRTRTYEEIFVKDSPVAQKVLREYIKKNHILVYECAICGFDGEGWEGKIALELDHINGDNTDNRLCNLRYLCPNCHATTRTYRGRNKHLKSKYAGVAER